MTVKAVLFDKDGTLIDFGETFDTATRYVLDQMFANNPDGLKRAADLLDFDLFNNQVSNSSIIVAGTATDIAHLVAPILQEPDVSLVASEIGLHYGNACLKSVEALPKAEQSLSELQQMGLVLGVATNDDEANAKGQMDVLGFSGYFSHIFGADSGHGAKPEAGMILAFCQHNQIAPEHVIMVGDSTHDLHAGRMAGAITCAVETGPADRTELSPHADHILPSIADLPDLVRKLNG